MAEQLQGESAPYYSESELCGAVTVFFSNEVSPRNFQMALVVTQPS
jgi:hypothetical protein